MKYNGVELKEITETQIFDEPKKMLVWDSELGGCIVVEVVAIVKNCAYPVISAHDSWKHCAEIPEQKPVTNRELARWLAEGNGELRRTLSVNTSFSYAAEDANKKIEDFLTIRKWNDDDWHKPTREYLGLEDK